MRVLKRVLGAIGGVSDALEGRSGSYDDAAILEAPPKGHLLLQTTDFLRIFLSDPYIFGQITTLHCFADIYAMGGWPASILPTAVVQFTTEDKMEEELVQVMMGVKKICNEAECKIAGGHTAEGVDMALGITVNGIVRERQLLKKTDGKMKQALILTKPLGTGMILAAEMKGKAKAQWVEAAVVSMLKSNGHAVEVFQRHDVTACTDVSGFGLLGHLSEMLNPQISFEIQWKSIPIFPGVIECCANGWLSTLHPQNNRVQSFIAEFDPVQYGTEFPALVDPQTSGGLLALVPDDKANSCIEALRSSGFTAAAVIGHSFETPVAESSKIRIGRERGDQMHVFP